MHIVHYYPRALVGDGGATRAARGWARAIAAAGHEVTVLCQDGGSRSWDDDVDWRPVRHFGRGRLLVPARIAPGLAKADFLVMHSGWVLHNVRAAMTARRLGVPYIITPHGAYHPSVLQRRRIGKRVWWSLLEGDLLSSAAAIHLSFSAEESHVRLLGYRGQTIVAPYGIDVPAEANWDGGSGDYVLWLGRFDIEHKGLDLLVDAIAQIPERQRPRLRLHGPDWRGDKQRLIDRVRECHLDDWIHIGSAVYGREKWQALRRARLFVYPSRWDSNSVSILEAAAAGIPVLTTTTTFLGPELGVNGAAIVTEPNAEALSEGLSRGLNAAGLHGETARRVVEKHYSWVGVARSFLEQVERL